MKRLLLCLCAATTCFGCSIVLVDEENQCATTTDCESRGFENTTCRNNVCVEVGGGTGGNTSDAWACVGQDHTDPPREGLLQVEYQYVRLADPDPLANLTVTACLAFDLECENPVAGPVYGNEEGFISIDLEPSFQGYFEIFSDGTIPVIAVFPIPMEHNCPFAESRCSEFPGGIKAELPTETELTLLSTMTGIPIDPELAMATLVVVDCNGKPAAGVQAIPKNLHVKTETYYTRNGLPSQAVSETDDSGVVGFLNLPPTGYVTIEAFVPEARISLGETVITTREGTYTLGSIYP